MSGKSSITASDFRAIVDAYKEVGANALRIARITGRNRQTITKALRRGWPELGFPPICPHRSATVGEGGTSSSTGSAATSSTASTSPTDGATAAGPTTSTPAATGPDGFTSKQAAARRQEEDAIAAGVSNLVGTSIVTTKILQKMIEQAPNILSKIGGDGEDAISPREYVRLIRELSKVNREASDSLNRLMAAGRLNTGEAGAITEHRHTGTVGVVAVSDDPVERQKRLDHYLDIHARSRAHVPGAYRGEEQGIIDVTPVNDNGPAPETRAALVSLQEEDEIAAPLGKNSEEAEADARRALAARSMPAQQIDRVVERARGKASREGRALGDVLDEMLAAEPGRA